MTIGPIRRTSIQDFLSILRPPERLLISEWADKFAYVPMEGNAEPGKYRLSRMPHQAAMLDDPIEPGVRETFHMMASQAGGKTVCGAIRIEYAIQFLKESAIIVRATKETASEWMRDKFLPMVEATPAMNGLLIEPRKRDSRSTSLNRRFPGGRLKVIGAKSPAAFRGSSARIIEQDEIDAYQVNKEGDPCAQGDRAAITFQNAWKVKYSTPTLVGFSRIHAGCLLGDQQHYFVPCHHCGHMQWLDFWRFKFSFTPEELARLSLPNFKPGDFEWDLFDEDSKDRKSKQLTISTKDTIYVCEKCKRGWTDQQRIAAYLSGNRENPAIVVCGNDCRAEWRPTAQFSGIRSRYLPGTYLTMGLEKGFENYHQQFAENFLKAKAGGRETLMTWWNMFLALPFEDAGEKVDWKELGERAEDYSDKNVPAEVCWINGGADVQDDRVEILAFGWGQNQECWILHHHVIYGDLDKPEMQEKVFNYLTTKEFSHPILGKLKFKSVLVDSAHKTPAVYRLCGRRARSFNIWSVRGFDDMAGVIQTKTERRFGGLKVNLDVSAMKSQLYSRLKNTEPGPTYIHFSKSFGPSFYSGLCSEKCVVKKLPNGGVKRKWVKLTSSTRNEILDMANYACGDYLVCRPDHEIEEAWKQIEAKLPKEKSDPEAKPIEPEKEQVIPQAKSPALPKRRYFRFGHPFARQF